MLTATDARYEFEIRQNIYENVLVQAVRTFFLPAFGICQSKRRLLRPEWADAASHLQDKKARDFLKKGDASTETDVSGGWYDAGDFQQIHQLDSQLRNRFYESFSGKPGCLG
jgi:endoglucanase